MKGGTILHIGLMIQLKQNIRDNYFVWTNMLEEYLCHACLLPFQVLQQIIGSSDRLPGFVFR